jgi:hypothetical protein
MRVMKDQRKKDTFFHTAFVLPVSTNIHGICAASEYKHMQFEAFDWVRVYRPPTL